MAITYKDAGVDWQLGDTFVHGIRSLVERTYTEGVRAGVGGYASLYHQGNGRYLAAGTDGVGTKLKLAQALNRHDTIGIDLVAMCANDVICVGARPMFFLDYIVCEKLDVTVSTAIVKGISDACVESGMALVGGETAEHPGAFPANEYDLAGFCVGEVMEPEIVDGTDVREGDAILCLSSSGLHSNGFSLVRKLIDSAETELMARCLTPTRLYVKPILALREKFRLKGMAHITGSAFNKVTRISKELGFQFKNLPPPSEVILEIASRSKLDAAELFSTFNMGTGFVVVVEPSEAEASARFLTEVGIPTTVGGIVTSKKGKVEISTSDHHCVLGR